MLTQIVRHSATLSADGFIFFCRLCVFGSRRSLGRCDKQTVPRAAAGAVRIVSAVPPVPARGVPCVRIDAVRELYFESRETLVPTVRSVPAERTARGAER